jgi:hypothetical protein
LNNWFHMVMSPSSTVQSLKYNGQKSTVVRYFHRVRRKIE